MLHRFTKRLSPERGATIALAVWLELAGLPALPGLSLGFLLPNADRIWRAVRNEGFGSLQRDRA